MRKWWPVWVLGAAVVGLGLSLWATFGQAAWMEQILAWCM